MKICSIETEDDYNSVLQRISILMDLEPEVGSPDGDELEMLVTMVEKYEDIHWPISPPELPEDT
jgi:HTH-type transcriptional regulator/antitoxin HigA